MLEGGRVVHGRLCVRRESGGNGVGMGALPVVLWCAIAEGGNRLVMGRLA